MITEVTEADFEQKAIKSAMPVVVDFWAPWCKPCQMIAPLMEKLAKDYEGRFKFCKLNVDQNPQLASKYGVMSIPFLLFFRDGQPVDQVVGAVTESRLKLKVEELI
jgi:thioredoxin 1